MFKPYSRIALFCIVLLVLYSLWNQPRGSGRVPVSDDQQHSHQPGVN